LERDREDESFDSVDVSGASDCSDLEVLAVTAQHSVYALIGRHEADSVRAFHAADPLLVDLLIQKLGEAGGIGGLD
jgi:hypothetical protein